MGLPLKRLSGLRARVYHTSDKQNGTGLNVADEKDERMINRDLDWLLCSRSQPHHHRGGGCSFRAGLIDRDSALAPTKPQRLTANVSSQYTDLLLLSTG